MNTRYTCITYLLGAVLTFGDLMTNPKIKPAGKKPEDEARFGQAVIFLCACWPLWWSGRFFKWVKQPSTQEAA